MVVAFYIFYTLVAAFLVFVSFKCPSKGGRAFALFYSFLWVIVFMVASASVIAAVYRDTVVDEFTKVQIVSHLKEDGSELFSKAVFVDNDKIRTMDVDPYRAGAVGVSKIQKIEGSFPLFFWKLKSVEFKPVYGKLSRFNNKT